MKKLLKMCAVFTLLLGFASTSSALTVPFSDNFDSENGNVGQLNYTGFANWTIIDGTVDLIGNGFWDFLPGHGLYIDMDGSTSNPGKIFSSSSFDLQPGTYTLTFDLAGNQSLSAPADPVTVQMAMGSLLNKTYTLANNAPFTTFTETIIVSSATSASLTFEGTGSDNIGMLLDNITFVPEPATILLLGLGGLLLRKRKA